MRTLIVLTLIVSLGTVQAQDVNFSVTVNNDSILAGNQIAVQFSLENAQGTDFYFPDFDNGLVKVGGCANKKRSISAHFLTKNMSSNQYFVSKHKHSFKL